jgi:hypothetical protein
MRSETPASITSEGQLVIDLGIIQIAWVRKADMGMQIERLQSSENLFDETRPWVHVFRGQLVRHFGGGIQPQ